MKVGFYPKLAVMGILKNKRLYVPYILTCIGMVMMQYIITFLSLSPIIGSMEKGENVQNILSLGVWVIAVFAAIFLFYTNSFLIRRRKKEFGLYNILGMGKRNIGHILFWESIIEAVVSLIIGLGVGIALSKLAELGLINMIDGSISYNLSICVPAVTFTAALFAGIFVLILINNLFHIRLSNPMALLKSESEGEKPPKANWVFGIAGAVILAAAYYIAVSIKNPLSALTWFFIAVIMVIAATYMLFVSGSVVFCRILQKNKKYYYKSNHFVSVSSMAFRMKRNGAGLASICILGTMVLVMIASSACLYIGKEDSLRTAYPRDMISDFQAENAEKMNDELISGIKAVINDVLGEKNLEAQDIIEYKNAQLCGLIRNGVLQTDWNENGENPLMYEELYYVYLIPLSYYNNIMGTNIKLEQNDALIYMPRGTYPFDKLTVKDSVTINVKGVLGDFPVTGEAMTYTVPTLFAVIPDFDETVRTLEEKLNTNGGRDLIQTHWYYAFNLDAPDEIQIEMFDRLWQAFRDNLPFACGYSLKSLASNKADFYNTFGSLFFLGIILSIVFIFAAVLIIYYKQISEGYEDMARFEIMQKVGMTKKDIRKSINSQMLTVFLLPLVMAGVHLAFAFPMICKLITLFNVINTNLLILTTLVSFFVFALFYTLVYRITSNAYYNIVSGAKEGK